MIVPAAVALTVDGVGHPLGHRNPSAGPDRRLGRFHQEPAGTLDYR
jgi:hypothetical protein